MRTNFVRLNLPVPVRTPPYLKFASNSANIAASSSTSAVPAFGSTVVGKDALKKSQ